MSIHFINMKRVPMCTQRHFQGKVGAEAEVGLHHVRPGWQWVHHEAGDARDRHRHLQNGEYPVSTKHKDPHNLGLILDELKTCA